MNELKPFDVVLENGTLIDPVTGLNGSYDVGVRDGVIAAVDASLKSEKAIEQIDVTNHHVIPVS